MSLRSSEELHGWKHRLGATVRRQDVLLAAIFAAMVAVFSAVNPRFFSLAAAANILQDFSPVVLMAAGQTFVIASGGIDLSVGSVLGLAGVAMALVIRTLNDSGFNPAVTIALGLGAAMCVGAFIGLLNGLLIAYARIVPFIATLAMMGAAAGLTIVITGGVEVAGGPREVILLGSSRFLGVFTTPVVVAFLILVIAWASLSRTRFGRWTYAVGSNFFAARAAGIDLNAHIIRIYMLSGVLSALAGAFVYFRLGSGSPLSGRGGELSSIAAAVIGGMSLQGGAGRMTGSIMGALITTSVLSGLILIGVEPNWQQVVIAALIAIAVGVQGIGGIGRERA